MKTEIAVITFPGSNCDRDIITAAQVITGRPPRLVWHKDGDLGTPDLVLVPGGFSFGDYLRCGAIAARAPAMDGLRAYAERGGMAVGICNGFQIMIECGMLPGALIRNRDMKFVCRRAKLKTHQTGKAIMGALADGETLTIPVAHNDGRFFADDETLARIAGEGQIAFTYHGDGGNNPDYNPNGSLRDIAGVTSANGRILGLMPHPERMMGEEVGGSDGRRMLEAIIAAAAGAGGRLS